jgi:hypothetical protein
MTPVVVRGRASPEELAAVLAALITRRGVEAPPSRYELWRRTRVAVRRS